MESQNLKIRSLGRLAEKFLYQYDSGGVIVVFERCFYLERAGDLICIGSSAIGRGPLNAIIEDDSNFSDYITCVTKEQAVTWEGRVLNLGDFLKIDFRDAAIWTAPSSKISSNVRSITNCVHTFVAQAEGRFPAQGMAPLVFQHLFPDQVSRIVTCENSSDRLFRVSVRHCIANLENWLHLELGRSESSVDPESLIDDLLGLGPGLTPSGDDFIGGLLVTLRMLKCDFVLNNLARVVSSKARTKTNYVSAAHLGAAIQGEAIEAFHLLMNDILQGRFSRLNIHSTAIDGIGHSSGWDMASGGIFAVSQWLKVH